LVTLALTIQRKAVTVLADEDVDYERVAILAAGDDLVAHWCAHDLGLAVAARELLALVLAHDHLRGDQVDRLGRFVPDARALLAAARARALTRRDGDRVLHTPHILRRWLATRRTLGWRLGLRLLFVVDARLVA